MKPGNMALSALIVILLTSMVWVNTELRTVYNQIDLTDKLRNYLSIDTDEYSILKISGSNGYPIEIHQSDRQEMRVLRSRLSQIEHKIHGDTLIIHFSGARVSPSSLVNTATPPGIMISSTALSEIILEDTHNRVSGFDQSSLHLNLRGSSYTELSDNRIGSFSVQAMGSSSFEFQNKSSADTALFRLKGGSVGFLEGLSYHVIEPIMEDSSLVVLSKNALQELMHTQ
ncbi:MAG: hypothetical protein HEP71_02850 [Roseivirga sp.]|nr:hypothetical protein [Roseivirga sp.]